MKRYATATIITLLVIAIALPALGYGFGQRGSRNMQDRNFDGRGYAGQCHGPYGINAALTDEQYKNLKSLHDRHIEDTIPLRSELFTKRSELKLLWNKENLDGNMIKAKYREMDSVRNQLRDKMIDYRLKANELVPSDQRKGFCGGNGGHQGFMGKSDYMPGNGGMGRMQW